MPIDRTNPLNPRFWGGHLVLLLALAAAVLLAMWQYSAWDAGRTAAARDLSNSPAQPLQLVMGPDDPFPGSDLGRRVTFEGDWLPDSTVYVSGRRLHGKTGYWVLTPVRVGASAVPVVRGWSEQPTAPRVEGSAKVEGWLQAGEGDRPGDQDPHDDVISSVRIATLTEHVDRDLYSGYVVSAAPGPALVAVPSDAVPPVSSNTALRNLLYAIQWLAFGGFAGFIWWRWVRDTAAAGSDLTDDPIDSGE